jgi:nitroreductase
MCARRTNAERSAATRTQVIAAARALFTSEGYAATSMAQVARAAEVSTGALYHHWTTKVDLLAAVVSHLHREIAAEVQATTGRAESPRQRLDRAAAVFLRRCADRDVARILLVDGPAALGPRGDELDSRWWLGPTRELLRAAGELSDPDLLAVALLGSLTALGREVGRGPRTPDAALHTFRGILDSLFSTPMDVYEAMRSRRSVRRFLDRPVPPEVLSRVVGAALRAPSGGNVQPWHVVLLSGARLHELKARIRRRVSAGDTGDTPPVPPYPPDLPALYRQRIDDMGARRYAAIGVPRDDRDGRARVRAGNWECFGAPAALFCYLDAGMLPPQWMDVGMFLQSVMLLLRAEGLHSCPQIAWAEYHRTVAEVVGPPPGHVLACGMSIGYADPGEPEAPAGRAPLSEVLTVLDDGPGRPASAGPRRLPDA